MSFLITLAGLIVGHIVLSTVFDLLLFDVPFTFRIRHTDSVDTPQILLGSITSLLIRAVLLTLILWSICTYLGDYAINFALAMLLSGLWGYLRRDKRTIAELYFAKHHQNVRSTLREGIYNESGFDYEAVKRHFHGSI